GTDEVRLEKTAHLSSVPETLAQTPPPDPRCVQARDYKRSIRTIRLCTATVELSRRLQRTHYLNLFLPSPGATCRVRNRVRECAGRFQSEKQYSYRSHIPAP